MTAEAPTHPLAAGVVRGEQRALARVCRLVDDGVGEYLTILKQLFPFTGKAWTVGITGTPGAGKSTLTDKLIAAFRADDKRVAVVAIDPTSPFTGGAILGDRIRMQRHHADPGVFIRSLATRGALGGLSRSAADVIRVCDASGADVVLVETVGVGQDELEVTRCVDTTLVVMAPGLGDEVQAIKAGILECADVFAVNKADREGADMTQRDLELMIAMGESMHRPPPGHHGHHGHHAMQAPPSPDAARAADEPREGPWSPPVERCIATKNEGIESLMASLARHHRWLEGTEAGAERRLQRLGEAMRNQLRNTLIAHADRLMGAAIDQAVAKVAARAIDPYTAAEELVAAFRA
ncbi:MAG: methylmalonyl Co-A mutase-associated GTPase MeaB [Polyangiaceae bacterium]